MYEVVLVHWYMSSPLLSHPSDVDLDILKPLHCYFLYFLTYGSDAGLDTCFSPVTA